MLQGQRIALYVARIFGREAIIRPIVPLSTLEAGFWLRLYGFVKFMRDRQKSLVRA